MEEKILRSLMLRPGMEDRSTLLRELIKDSIQDIRNYLNYADNEDLPEGCSVAVKQMTLIKFNRDGAEGIQSESQSSGNSTTYSDALPEGIRRTIRRYRRLPR